LALPLAFSSAHPRAAKGNQLERFLCMALFAWAIWMPQTVQENSAVRWSSQMINTLQMQFNRFITHQID
jgi:inner membrane protein